MKKIFVVAVGLVFAQCAIAEDPLSKAMSGKEYAGISTEQVTAAKQAVAGAQAAATEVSAEDKKAFSCVSRVYAEALSKSEMSNSEEERAEWNTNPNLSAGQKILVALDSPVQVTKAWIYQTFNRADVLDKVLECLATFQGREAEFLNFPPIAYTFANGRVIEVDYTSQLQILKHRRLLAEKREIMSNCVDVPGQLPCNAQAKIVIGPDMEWVNTQPAWYGIIVVQAGTLDEFVGKDKYNNISVNWMHENRGRFFPRNSNVGLFPVTTPMCTTGSAFADDKDVVNLAAHKTQAEDDSFWSGNDYYVNNDMNLEWITWTQVTADVVLTIVSFGGSLALRGGIAGARAARLIKNIGANMAKLIKIPEVAKWVENAAKLEKAEKALKVVEVGGKSEKVLKAEKELEALNKTWELADKIKKASSNGEKLADLEKQFGKTRKEIQELLKMDKNQTMQKIASKEKSIADLTANQVGDLAKLEKEIEETKKVMKELESSEDVKKYMQSLDDLKKVEELIQTMKFTRLKQTGNVIARETKASKGTETVTRLKGIKGLWAARKAIINSGKTMNKIKTGKASGFSNKVREFGFKTSYKLGTWGAKRAGQGGALLAAWDFAKKVGKEFYDWSEVGTGQFTSNVLFYPIMLLSADAIKGQENVVSHGMWLMWAGATTSAADDDAAYLQAMDFAHKFHEDMMETQTDLQAAGRSSSTLCDVDIYVVRPMIRNPIIEDGYVIDGDLYYLIMNDVPWTVRQ